jgi:lipoyl(octanoyl) transferase
VKIRPFERREYAICLDEMRRFTASRDKNTEDEIWLVEHERVFTLGLASKSEHLLALGDIPCISTERGGQVTFHGPGQVVAYLLLDLRRAGIMVRDLVFRMESAVIETLASYGVTGVRAPGAPGVYVRAVSRDEAADGDAEDGRSHIFPPKIASLGIKISRGCSYHGLALNVAMDLEPFSRINPCGFPGQVVTDLTNMIDSNVSKHSQIKPHFEECGRTLLKFEDSTFIDCPPKSSLSSNEVAERLGVILKRHLTVIQ